MNAETELKTVKEQYRKCVNYNVLCDYYDKSRQHENFYLGNQWRGVNAPDLDKPVLNFIRRVCSFLTAMVTSDDISVFLSPYIYTARDSRKADLLNIELERVIESAKLKSGARRTVQEAVINGDGYLYWLCDGGRIGCETIKGTNIMFANPYLDDVQKQPYILVEKRDYLDNVRRTAAKNRQGAKRIKADENYMNSIESEPMVTLITKMYKKAGKVWYMQFTKDSVVTPPVCLGYSLYPVAKFTWDRRSGSYHGMGVVENLIPNQIAVNKLWAMALLHQKNMAFPKVFFDKTKIDRWTNRVGAAIAVIGNPSEAVASSFKAEDMSGQLVDLVEKTIAFTKEFMGANDTSLGNVTPQNTSAILAVQRSATIPLENQKQEFYQFLEDCVLIILDIMKNDFGIRYVQTANSDGQYTAKLFDFSQIDSGQLSWSIQADNSTPWSEGLQMQTLENLYARQILTDAYDYVRAIPSSQLKNKDRILKKLESHRQQTKAGE